MDCQNNGLFFFGFIKRATFISEVEITKDLCRMWYEKCSPRFAFSPVEGSKQVQPFHNSLSNRKARQERVFLLNSSPVVV